MILRTYTCPGETCPPTCRCACYGCKHHCGAHNPPALYRWRQLVVRALLRRHASDGDSK